MEEVILTTHKGKPPPATNIQNESNYPVDDIWCSSGLTVLRTEY